MSDKTKKTEKEEDPILVWADLEMTGLNPGQDQIIEMATILSDINLNIIAKGPELIIHQPASKFNEMDEWNRNQHKGSGLWAKVVASEISCRDAEIATLEFIKKHVKPRQGVLSGNSIWQDRRFITLFMPELESYLHYRMVDISTIKTLTKGWYPAVKFEKDSSHRALDDIEASISELRFYRENIFKETR